MRQTGQQRCHADFMPGTGAEECHPSRASSLEVSIRLVSRASAGHTGWWGGGPAGPGRVGQETLQRGTGHTGPLARQGRHLDIGVLDQAQLLLDPVELLLLPPDVGLQHPRPLLQLLSDALEHAELGWKLQGGKQDQGRVISTSQTDAAAAPSGPAHAHFWPSPTPLRAGHGQAGCPREGSPVHFSQAHQSQQA